jgi:hypothetical protein
MRFDVLVELAAYATVDGYYREAVSSFAAALERFHEFYVQFQCTRHGNDEANLEATWKHVASQSERQLGAFTFVYLLEQKAAPPMLRAADVEFRSAGIHKGKLPARERTIEFGERVVQIMMAVLTPLRTQAYDLVQRAVALYLHKLQELARKENPNIAGMSTVTLVCLGRALSEPQPTLREWIKMLEARPHFAGYRPKALTPKQVHEQGQRQSPLLTRSYEVRYIGARPRYQSPQVGAKLTVGCMYSRSDASRTTVREVRHCIY